MVLDQNAKFWIASDARIASQCSCRNDSLSVPRATLPYSDRTLHSFAYSSEEAVPLLTVKRYPQFFESLYRAVWQGQDFPACAAAFMTSERERKWKIRDIFPASSGVDSTFEN